MACNLSVLRTLLSISLSVVGSVAWAAPESELAKPEDINLKGNIRVADITSSVGRIELRWPRSVEQLFGKTPERAMVDAAVAVSRALKASAFPGPVQNLNQEWSIVFIDADQPTSQIPMALISSCHPGWMTPPANIYIVAQKAANFCSGQKVSSSLADSRLAQVLIHEMGHAVDYQLLQEQFGRNRMRAEGFASWFEQYASDYSGVIPRGSVKSYYTGMAKESLASSGQFTFSGSASDYARASLFFSAVEDRRGIPGILAIYARMRKSSSEFIPALLAEMGWDAKKLSEEMSRVIK